MTASSIGSELKMSGEPIEHSEALKLPLLSAAKAPPNSSPFCCSYSLKSQIFLLPGISINVENEYRQ